MINSEEIYISYQHNYKSVKIYFMQKKQQFEECDVTDKIYKTWSSRNFTNISNTMKALLPDT